MSLYDDAAVALIAEGAAGKDGVLYNIKPEEKLKATELITEGGFENNNVDSNWSTTLSGTGSVTFSNNEAVLVGISGDNSAIYQTDIFEVGKTYKVSLTLDIREGAVKVGTGGTGQSNAIASSISTQGKHNYSFIHTVADVAANPDRLIIARISAPYDFTVDNVSVKEVEQKPLDFTFTRGSNLTATRVAPSGYIEKGRENVIKHSDDFSVSVGNDGWQKDNCTVTSGQDGYDGTTNAWKLASTVSTTSNSIKQNYSGISAQGDKVSTFSVYLKAGNTDWARLNMSGTGNVFFDLSGNGAVGTESSANIRGEIQKIGSQGWFRCSITKEGGADFDAVFVFIADSDGSLLASDHSESKHIFVQAAQLESGLVATDYIDSKSTTGKAGILEDSPRFDYTGGGCPHLLMEPDRRNLLSYSEYVGAWTGSQTTASFAISPDLSPEGQKNAYRVTRSTDATQVGTFATIPDEVKRYTGSIWVKRVSGSTTCKLLVTENVAVTKNITDDWTRIEETVASTSGNTTGRLYIQPAADGDVIDIYGAQFECAVSSVADTTLDRADYATSYIPTHGSEGTRLSDEAEPADFSEYIDGEDFTLFVHLAKNDELIRDRSSTGIRFSTRDHNSSAVRIYRTGFTSMRNHVYWEDLDADTSPSAHEIDEAGPVKVAIRRIYSTGEWTVFYDGAQQNQGFNANYDKFTQLTVDGDGDVKFINSILIFDRALTDDECIDLTT